MSYLPKVQSGLVSLNVILLIFCSTLCLEPSLKGVPQAILQGASSPQINSCIRDKLLTSSKAHSPCVNQMLSASGPELLKFFIAQIDNSFTSPGALRDPVLRE